MAHKKMNTSRPTSSHPTALIAQHNHVDCSLQDYSETSLDLFVVVSSGWRLGGVTMRTIPLLSCESDDDPSISVLVSEGLGDSFTSTSLMVTDPAFLDSHLLPQPGQNCQELDKVVWQEEHKRLPPRPCFLLPRLEEA